MKQEMEIEATDKPATDVLATVPGSAPLELKARISRERSPRGVPSLATVSTTIPADFDSCKAPFSEGDRAWRAAPARHGYVWRECAGEEGFRHFMRDSGRL